MSNYNDEIRLKDFFLTVGRYFREVKRRWKWLVLGTLVFMLAGLAKHYLTPKTYPTELTFMVDEDTGGAAGLLGGLLGSFGGLRGGQTNLDKVLSISTSRRIINETLLKKATVDGVDDYIANHILKLYDFASYWKKRNRQELVDYRFSTAAIDEFNATDNLVLKHVYKCVISPKDKEKALIRTRRDLDAGILYFDGRTLSPELTVSMLDSLYNVVLYYHEGRKKEVAKRTYDIIANKVDSLEDELSRKQYALAGIKDRSFNVIRERDRVSVQKIQGEIQTLSFAYAEGVKNREIAALELENQTSNLLLLDKPVLPVATDHGSLLMKLIKFGILGFFIMAFSLGMNTFYKDVMSEGKPN